MGRSVTLTRFLETVSDHSPILPTLDVHHVWTSCRHGEARYLAFGRSPLGLLDREWLRMWRRRARGLPAREKEVT
jgi:hypothetical protein